MSQSQKRLRKKVSKESFLVLSTINHVSCILENVVLFDNSLQLSSVAELNSSVGTNHKAPFSDGSVTPRGRSKNAMCGTCVSCCRPFRNLYYFSKSAP